MRRHSLCLLPLLFLLACGNDEMPAKTPKATPPVPVVEEPVRELTDEEQIDLIRDEYELVVREMTAEVLAKDSLSYECDEANGQFLLYTDPVEKELRMVINSFAQGDHYGVTEYWYFKNGEPFFMLREAGSWQFGGPLTEDTAGNEVPGTIDNITEARFYFVDGVLIRHLVKEYQIKSWEDNRPSDEIPSETMAHNGEKPQSYTWVAAVMSDRKVDCEAIVVE